QRVSRTSGSIRVGYAMTDEQALCSRCWGTRRLDFESIRIPRRTTRRFRLLSRHAVVLVLSFLVMASCKPGIGTEQAQRFADHWIALYNSHDVVGLCALYAETGNFVLPGMIWFAPSRDELRKAATDIWSHSPDMKITSLPAQVTVG